ncbi:MAG: cysteine desulfurase [bacterium]|nr:cysteine desulfurase [bacterium]
MAVKKPVYLDFQASCPMDPAVLEVLQRVQRDHFGNPSSNGHSFGWAAQTLVENARKQVADLVGAREKEIIFTSGATEANNLALLGIANTCPKPGKIITTCLEHSSISEPVAELEKSGWQVISLKSDNMGMISPEELVEKIDDSTVLVSIVAAQNEIGTLQPLSKISKICREKGIVFHSDAAQAADLLSLDSQNEFIDLISLSAHKIYGPKGVGALRLRQSSSTIRLKPLLFGGGQEGGNRPGTLNVPGIAAFGEACRLALENRDRNIAHLSKLRDRLWGCLKTSLTGIHLNGAFDSRLPGNLNVRFDGLGAVKLLPRLSVLALSTGSACRSSQPGPSPILLALGLSREQAASSLRIGVGRFTTEEEVDFAAERIIAAVTRIRAEKK